MKLKNIFSTCLACCAIVAALTGCSKDEEAFFTVSENDAPRILNTDFPDGGFSINRNENLQFEVLVTPTDYTTVKWITDNKEVVGNKIDEPFEAGSYTLKILAVTVKGKETSRTMKLTVKALEGDPQAGSDMADRVVAAGAAARLHGTKLDDITKVVINGEEVAATYNSADKCIEYTVPATLSAGSYRVTLVNDKDERFGADMIVVVTKPTVLNSTFAGMSKDAVTIEGFYLNDVATLTIGGKECTITEKTADKLTFIAPELEAGDYELKGTTTSGEAVSFCKDNALAESALFIVATEKVVWTGDYAVSWELPDGNPNKEWREISQEEFAKYEVGHTLTFSLKLDETATYHQYQFDNWEWASLPGQQNTTITADTDVPVEITQELKDAVAAKAFCIHGHGFSVVRVTYK
jgi:hypothetical protein